MASSTPYPERPTRSSAGFCRKGTRKLPVNASQHPRKMPQHVGDRYPDSCVKLCDVQTCLDVMSHNIVDFGFLSFIPQQLVEFVEIFVAQLTVQHNGNRVVLAARVVVVTFDYRWLGSAMLRLDCRVFSSVHEGR